MRRRTPYVDLAPELTALERLVQAEHLLYAHALSLQLRGRLNRTRELLTRAVRLLTSTAPHDHHRSQLSREIEGHLARVGWDHNRDTPTQEIDNGGRSAEPTGGVEGAPAADRPGDPRGDRSGSGGVRAAPEGRRRRRGKRAAEPDADD